MKAQRLDIGFVGTGRMGRPMAQHVLAAGQRLYVCDVDPAAYAQLIDAGATPAATPAELAKKVRVVVTSLPEPAQVDAVAVGSDGLLRGARHGLLVIETSTIGPSQSRALARRFAGAGVDFVDAPVSGGVASAEAASLTAMVGGEKAQFDRALPVLRCFASRVIHMGPPALAAWQSSSIRWYTFRTSRLSVKQSRSAGEQTSTSWLCSMCCGPRLRAVHS